MQKDRTNYKVGGASKIDLSARKNREIISENNFCKYNIQSTFLKPRQFSESKGEVLIIILRF